MRENKRAKLLHDLRESQQRSENAGTLAARDVSTESKIEISELSMVVNASQSKGTARDLSDASVTDQAVSCLENDGFDPELDAKLKLAAEEMMREVLEECENKERVRARNIKKRVAA